MRSSLDGETRSNYQELENRILAWAGRRTDVRAVIAVGSRARQDGNADSWSDLDLILFVTDPRPFVAQSEWLVEFGEVLLPVLNIPREHKPEWLVLYAGGMKGDFMLVEADGDLVQMLTDFPYQDVLARGYNVLLDKTGTNPATLPSPSSRAISPPDSDEFIAVIHRFLLTADKVARCLARAEWFRAHLLLGGELRRNLLTMLEWHAQAHTAADTWYDGRHLAQWADPQTQAVLAGLFPSYDGDQIGNALTATTRLFLRLTRETAQIWQLPWPEEQAGRVTTEIESVLAASRAMRGSE